MSFTDFSSRSEPRRLIERREMGKPIVPDSAVMPREMAQALVEKVVKMSKADDVQVNVNSGYQADLRFAANQVSTSGGVVNGQVAVTSTFGKKHATTVTNDLADDALRRAVEKAESLAKLSPDDPEVMPALGPQTYVPVNGYFDSTANLTAEDRARAALTALQPARSAGDLKAAGFIVVNVGSNALGNGKGLFAYSRSTAANYTLTVRTDDGTGSGWAGAEHPDWKQIDFAAMAQRAIDKARLSRNPVAIEPGRYEVILEPQAVGDLVQLMGFALNARTADEGRSAFAKQGGGNKIGEKIVDSRVTLFSDPQDPQLLSQPYDNQGLPLSRQVWIENGVLKQLVYTRFWAQKQSRQATGFPSSIKLVGGTTSMEDMIKSTARGVLVTRLWYLRQVDPRTILFTGLTRDGTFLIENGKISRSIKNFRFNESPLFLLANLEDIGPAVRLGGTEQGGPVVMPVLKAKDFNFTSLSDAV